MKRRNEQICSAWGLNLHLVLLTPWFILCWFPSTIQKSGINFNSPVDRTSLNNKCWLYGILEMKLEWDIQMLKCIMHIWLIKQLYSIFQNNCKITSHIYKILSKKNTQKNTVRCVCFSFHCRRSFVFQTRVKLIQIPILKASTYLKIP